MTCDDQGRTVYTIDDLLMELRFQYNMLAELRLHGVLYVVENEDNTGYEPYDMGNVVMFPNGGTIQ